MRRSARYTGVAVAMAAALLVSGCGSSGDGDEGKSADEQSQDSGDGNGDEATDAEPGTVQGVWTTTVDGKDLILTIVGDAATVVQDDAFCTGRLTEADGPSLSLKCPGGDQGEDRTNGKVESVDSESLEVSWNGGDTDTFDRQADAPSDLPTDLGGLEDLVPNG